MAFSPKLSLRGGALSRFSPTRNNLTIEVTATGRNSASINQNLFIKNRDANDGRTPAGVSPAKKIGIKRVYGEIRSASVRRGTFGTEQRTDLHCDERGHMIKRGTVFGQSFQRFDNGSGRKESNGSPLSPKRKFQLENPYFKSIGKTDVLVDIQNNAFLGKPRQSNRLTELKGRIEDNTCAKPLIESSKLTTQHLFRYNANQQEKNKAQSWSRKVDYAKPKHRSTSNLVFRVKQDLLLTNSRKSINRSERIYETVEEAFADDAQSYIPFAETRT